MTKPKPLPEIKDCPWCGSKEVGISPYTDWWITCEKCQCAGPFRRTQRGAINAWNRLPRFTPAECFAIHRLVIERINASNNFDGVIKPLRAIKTKLEGMI